MPPYAWGKGDREHEILACHLSMREGNYKGNRFSLPPEHEGREIEFSLPPEHEREGNYEGIRFSLPPEHEGRGIESMRFGLPPEHEGMGI